MALGERFRSGGARGIARFLSDHQHCDAGFDVHREAGAGTGRLMITCVGCGESIAYKAAAADELVAVPPEPNGGGAGATRPEPSLAAPPRPTSPGPGGGGAGGEERSFRLTGRRAGDGGPRSWIPIALIAALTVGGVALIAVGLTRSEDDGNETAAESPQAPPQTIPTETAPPEPEPAPEPPPAANADQGAPQQIVLNRREFQDLFAMGVPAGWEGGEEEAVTVIEARGGVATIRVYFELGTRPAGQLAQDASRFLADEHPGGDLTKSRTARIGGARAATVSVDYGSGTETAVVLSSQGHSFLILKEVERRASPAIEAQAQASVRSFRAKG